MFDLGCYLRALLNTKQSSPALLPSTFSIYGGSIATGDLEPRGHGQCKNLMHGSAEQAAKPQQIKKNITLSLTSGNLTNRSI